LASGAANISQEMNTYYDATRSQCYVRCGE
jgi:hypothetical protein